MPVLPRRCRPAPRRAWMLGAATRGDVLLQVVRGGGVEAAIGASVLSELLQWRQWRSYRGGCGMRLQTSGLRLSEVERIDTAHRQVPA